MEVKIKEFLKKCIEVVMNSLEECIDSITLEAGKRMLKVWIVSACMLLLSIILELIKVFTFISWQEALTCLILATIICLVDQSNQNTIHRFIKQIKRREENG